MGRNLKKQRRRKKRQQRRLRRRAIRQIWTDFVPKVELPRQGGDPGGVLYENSKYSVALREHADCVHLSIANKDHSPRHDWRDLQRIKNELIGPEAEAVELYPRESRLIDTTNSFHLWAVRDGKFPIGFDSGRRVQSAMGSGLPQRAPLIAPLTPGEAVWVQHTDLASADQEAHVVMPANIVKVSGDICTCTDEKGALFTVPVTRVFRSYEELRSRSARLSNFVPMT